MFRAVVGALLLAMAFSAPAQAAESVSGDDPRDPCFAEGGSARAAAAASSPTQSPAGPTMERAPDPYQAAPGSGTTGDEELPIVSESAVTWVQDGLTHTVRTIVRQGIRKGRSSLSGGGHLAAPLSGVCTYVGETIITQPHTVCGGGCITQYLKRTANRYSNSADAINVYYDRIYVHLWWERQGSTYINFGGPAYTEWREPGRDCINTDVSRITSNSFSPQWANDWQTYTYYWDETWLPTMAAPGNYALLVFTQTPTNYFGNLYTELFLQ